MGNTHYPNHRIWHRELTVHLGELTKIKFAGTVQQGLYKPWYNNLSPKDPKLSAADKETAARWEKSLSSLRFSK